MAGEQKQREAEQQVMRRVEQMIQISMETEPLCWRRGKLQPEMATEQKQ
jgi:hypothetical protein